MIALLALIGGYFGLLGVLSIVARPYRHKLAALASELSRAYPGDEMVEDACRYYLGNAYSIRAAPVRFLIFVTALLIPGDVLDEQCREADRDHPGIFDDPRLHEMNEAFHASVAAVNPIFGLLAHFARAAFGLKAVIHHRGKVGRKLADYVDMTAPARA